MVFFVVVLLSWSSRCYSGWWCSAAGVWWSRCRSWTHRHGSALMLLWAECCPEDATISKQTPASELSAESSSERDDDAVTGSSSLFYAHSLSLAAVPSTSPRWAADGEQLYYSFQGFFADSLKHAADIKFLSSNIKTFLSSSGYKWPVCRKRPENLAMLLWRKTEKLSAKSDSSAQRQTATFGLDDTISDHRSLLQETEASSSLRVERVNPSGFHRVVGLWVQIHPFTWTLRDKVYAAVKSCQVSANQKVWGQLRVDQQEVDLRSEEKLKRLLREPWRS